MWGQVTKKMVDDLKARIIPTRVGTSGSRREITAQAEDHPHACGDKFIKNMMEISLLGSSPRVWGQDTDYKRVLLLKRIIPTRVGTSYILALFLAFS